MRISRERKFKVYYSQKPPYAHCYVVVIDGQIRLVTLWRANASKQKDISKGRYKL
jgi:hypothetical protein